MNKSSILLVLVLFTTKVIADSSGRFVYFGPRRELVRNDYQPINQYSEDVDHPILREESLPEKIKFLNSLLSNFNIRCSIVNSIGETENLHCGSAHITTEIESKKSVEEEFTIETIETAPEATTLSTQTENDQLINTPLELKILNVTEDANQSAENALLLLQSGLVINDLVNIHMSAYYQYLALAAFYNKESVALKGFANLYRILGTEDHNRVQKMIQFQHHRGGDVVLSTINAPATQQWMSPAFSIDFALALEQRNRRALNEAHRLAILHNDPHLRHFIEEELLHDQIEEISRLTKYRALLKLVGEGLGVFMFDKELQLLKENPVDEEEKI